MSNANGAVNDGSSEGTMTSSEGSGHASPIPTSDDRQESPVPSSADRHALERCRNALERLHLQQGDPVIFGKENIVKGTLMDGEREVVLCSNSYGLKTGDLIVYQYHVELNKILLRGTKAGVPLLMNEKENGRRVPDYTKFQNRQMYRKLLDAFIRKYPEVFVNGSDYYCYDQAATLFSLNEISGLDTTMELSETETHALIDRPFKVALLLKKPECSAFNVRDWKRNVSNDLTDETSNNIIRFLELATSRNALRHPDDHVMYESKKTYFMEPEKHGFTSPDLGCGKYLAAGASKTVARIEGPANKGSTVVVIDSKKTPFYQSANLLDMICLSLQIGPDAALPGYHRSFVQKYIKGLECFPTYGNRQKIPILLFSLADHDANAAKMQYGNTEISITQYYREKYGIRLKYPHWPLAISTKKIQGNRPYYPLELLHVADYQRVGNGNISSADVAAIVKACAVPPSVKTDEIVRCRETYGFESDEFLKHAKLEVLRKPLEVKGRIIKAPQIVYANGSMNPEENGKWRLPRPAVYVRCVQLGIWCAIFLNVPHERTSLNEFKQFVEMFYDECRKRGIDVRPPAAMFDIPCDQASIEEAFKEASSQECQFILFGHSDRDTTMHSVIKGFERKYQVITQCVRTKTIFNVMKKSPLSLENIVAKTNVKLGGLNYNIVLDNYPIDSSILFIGLAMNHPGGGLSSGLEQSGSSGSSADTSGATFSPANVSILGFAANDGVNPNEFVGNFYLQPMNRDENVGVLDKLIDEIMRRFVKNRQRPPSRIIFYRSGCNDGQYAYVLRYEIPIINAVIKKYAPGAPIAVIIPSKMHSFRFFKKDINPRARSDDQNIRPGTVIDGAVVSNAYCEFFLNSHLAIQGSAKTTKYTILHNTEKNATLDMFERFTNALCYDFQIVTSPTSVPAPIYIATRYAERGRQVYNTFESSVDAALPGYHQNGSGGHSNGQNGDGHVDKGSNGLGGIHTNGRNDAASPENNYFIKSLDYNYTKQTYLRDKRVNA